MSGCLFVLLFVYQLSAVLSIGDSSREHCYDSVLVILADSCLKLLIFILK